VDTNIKSIESAIKRLEAPGELASSLTANIPLVGSDVFQKNILRKEEMLAVRDDMRNAIQSTLRATLGAQFTEKEGEAIFNRAFNATLSDKENARRAKNALRSLKIQVKSFNDSVNYFQETGTLSGYTGPVPQAQNFVRTSEQIDTAAAFIKKAMPPNGFTSAQLKQLEARLMKQNFNKADIEEAIARAKQQKAGK